MKALQLAEFGRIDLVEVPDPAAPGAGEVRIDVVATGICGSDIHGFTGENGRRVPGQIMGHESVGRIGAIGDGVSGLSIGQPVTFNPVVIPESDIESFAGREQLSPNKLVIGVAPDIVASFAQQIIVPARNVVQLPESMPIELGALIEPLAVSVHAVRRTQVTRDDAVLVLGGGPIGQSVVLALLMAGVSKIAVTEMLAPRRELIEALGATALDPTAEDITARIAEVLGGAPAHAIDAVGITPTVQLACEATSLGATICLVGMGSPSLELSAFAISTGERTLTGSFTYTAQDFADAAAWMGTAPAQAHQLISRQVPMSAGHDEFTQLAAGGDTPGKVLVRLDQS